MASNTATIDKPIAEPKKRSYFVDLLVRLIKEKPLGTLGLLIVVILLLTGIFANQLAPYAMNKIDLTATLASPYPAHLLGTDNLGRDVLSNIIYGARISMIIGITATLCTMIVSIFIGALSATIGGTFDLILQRFVDAWMCIPGMMILLIMMSIMGKGVPQMILAMAIPGGIGGSRMIRSAVMAIRENQYIEANRAIGASTGWLLMRHIIPNIAPLIILGAAMQVGGMIMMESGLSFLGYGVPPGVPSWGSMLSNEGRQYMEIAPALAFWPGFALALVIFGCNMFGDALRDLMDPRLKGGVGSYTAPGEKQRKKIKARLRM
jgi:peptide/nickel transport system permease protein